jgi:type III pantothenate kinase
LNICIDIGNTNAKAGIFDDENLTGVYHNFSDRGIVNFIKERKPEHVLISSVRKGIGRIVQQASSISKTIIFDHKTPIPFSNTYGSPETLGLDRIAAVSGGQLLYPGTNCLIIDIGTCITYDILDINGVYHGGGISPGVEMRLKAMHKFTSRLPLVSPKGSPELVGKTTRECMLSGATLGTIAEVDGIISRYKQFFSDLTIIFCGGGAKFFESKIKGHIFAIPNLVLIGLNQILRYNLND